MRFTELMKTLGIPYRDTGHEHCRPGWVQIDCPYCNRKGHFRLGYNIRGRYCNCWSCGPQRIIDVLIHSGVQPGTAAKLFNDLEFERIEKPRACGKLTTPPGLGPIYPAHIGYLQKRGFWNIERLIALWRIKATTFSSGHLNWRIYIPIYYEGEAVSWTTRSITDKHEQRYISASLEEEKYSHKTLLYGEDYARHAIIICEGPLDVWKIGPGAVAVCGTGYSSAQIERMAKYPVRAVCFDNEPEGRKRAEDLCNRLEMLDGTTYNITLDSKDPGEATDREIQRVRRAVLGAE